MLHVAVILEANEVRLVLARSSSADLTRELARYAAEHASFQLTAKAEARFRALLERGKEKEAVDLYFRRGGRWAPERVVRRTVPFGRDRPSHAAPPS